MIVCDTQQQTVLCSVWCWDMNRSRNVCARSKYIHFAWIFTLLIYCIQNPDATNLTDNTDSNQAGWCCGKAQELYWGCVRFGSRLVHWVSWLTGDVFGSRLVRWVSWLRFFLIVQVKNLTTLLASRLHTVSRTGWLINVEQWMEWELVE
jgi:hypothetical protein